jgi:glucans biosynthesis protein
MFLTDRRLLLAALSASLVPAPALRALAAPSGVRLGPPQPFTYEALAARARRMAGQPWRPPDPSLHAKVAAIDFDAVQKIRFRQDHALWRGGREPYPVGFFHLNKYSADPVALHVIEQGAARPILWGPDYFDYGASGLSPATFAGMGFSGFRVLDGQDNPADWLAFQGASYFRAVGEDDQYGASARGIAVNTASPKPEEFPAFREFWLESRGQIVTIYALLDGRSVTGAYRFDAQRTAKGPILIDVHCDLFFRADIARLGIAPLTSMYWYGENARGKAADWRPEIHDSDGLAMWTGKGERIWRPLINPPRLQTNSFQDENPRGFGLMQRDRDFEHYQDDSVFYDRRPGIWVQPKGDWGAGAVELVEIPTDTEVMDNIVAFWRPSAAANKGGAQSFDYRLYWQDAAPGFPPDLARATATRIGRGGIPGLENWPRDRQKIVIDFEGGALADMPTMGSDVAAVVSASAGRIDAAYALRVAGTRRWRCGFDVIPAGKGPANLRCYLAKSGVPLTETWLYQYFPPA